MTTIERERLQKMMGENVVTLVEVLDENEYDRFHLPGAVNVPLDDDFERRIQRAAPDKIQPIVVYCMDKECDASAKAAELLERLGYDRVYDYAAGKMDWKDAGLPTQP